MPSHLRVVVDNTQSNPENGRNNDLAEESAEIVLNLLETLGDVNVIEMWQACINLPISRKDDHYNHFMARNWHHFSHLLDTNPQNGDLQRKHRLVNFFMMQVYMAVMTCKSNDGQELGLLRAPYKPTQLDFWVNRYAVKIINNDSSKAKNDFDPSPNDFGSRVKKIIESA